MPRPPDFSLELAWALAWLTLSLVALIVLGLLVLRWARWRNEPRMAAFEARWQPLLMRCMAGEDVRLQLPRLAARERWPFMKLWLHSQMSVQGPGRQRLADLGAAMGCREMALRRLRSTHYSERMVGLLALGFLRDASSTPQLLERLSLGSNHTVIYAGRALLEIDEAAHADAVLKALLACEGLDLSLASVMLKAFRRALHEAMRAQRPDALQGNTRVLAWLRLARALKLQMPTPWLAPFLTPEQDTEVLIAAIRLVQGEQGADLVAAQATHADWRVRAQAARALGYIGGMQEVPLLLQLVTDAQWWVRYRAAQALLRIPGMVQSQVLERVTATGDRYALSMFHAVLAEGGRA